MFNITNHQGKANQNYHITSLLLGWLIIKKTKDNNCWQGYGEEGTLVHCWGDCNLISHYEKQYGGVLLKLKVELPYDPEISPLGIYLKEIRISKRYLQPHLQCSIIHCNTQKQEVNE